MGRLLLAPTRLNPKVRTRTLSEPEPDPKNLSRLKTLPQRERMAAIIPNTDMSRLWPLRKKQHLDNSNNARSSFENLFRFPN